MAQSSLAFSVLFLGPAASKLAAAMLRGSQVCSALRATLRFALGLAFGPPFAALGRSAVFFLWAFFFGGWAVWDPWAEAHGCGAEQTGGLKPFFADGA
ncbi:hypothetical protein SapgrDRAFT_1255 [Saprospira grandis DSM 2844]|uniref:Uncharacterized protein n=1 Tax=Saprospira grandis DSM 2844 TaxID=694433 RepID=J1I3R8_9BACT|nr:hypothetical protein SapgrDRAFT_1255 [Saprospira grandis DSM 2844]